MCSRSSAADWVNLCLDLSVCLDLACQLPMVSKQVKARFGGGLGQVTLVHQR
jgi:hypothetical protein